jgi:secondary thiamine-phosphate synthase enzyme
MKILVAETAGFCWGVRRALDQAVDLAKKTDGRLATFGPLIHNTQKRRRYEVHHESIQVHTEKGLEFIELTQPIIEFVRQSGIQNGLVNVQTRHTTTGIMLNENEPLLLGDMKKVLEKIASAEVPYEHDNFQIRTANLCPEERVNGHSHCKAMVLGSSEMVNIRDGQLQLGRWQRIFLVELDGSRAREVSVMIMGA